MSDDTKTAPNGRLTYKGEDGLFRYPHQHLNHLNRLVLEHIADDDYVRILRGKINAFREAHAKALGHDKR